MSMSKKVAARVVLTMARPHGASPLDGTCLHGWNRSDKHMEFDYPNIMLELYFACEPSVLLPFKPCLIITISYLGKEDTEKDSNGERAEKAVLSHYLMHY